MSGIVTTGAKRLVLASGRAHHVLAQEVSEELGVEVLPMDAWHFANGEVYVRYGESVRGTAAFLLQSLPAPINTWLMENLIMIDALKRASAKRITAIAPSFPYARQDKKHRGDRRDALGRGALERIDQDRKSTRLNSSHVATSYAV